MPRTFATSGGSSGPTGTGTNTYVTYWSGASTLTGSDTLTFASNTLTVGKSGTAGAIKLGGSTGLATTLTGFGVLGFTLSLDGGTTLMRFGQVDASTLGIYTGDGTAIDIDIQAGSGKRVGLASNANPFSGNGIVVDSSNQVGIATASPSCKLDINDDHIRIRTSKTPASAGAAGNAGDMAWDSGFQYTCISSNSWVRVAHAAW